MVDQHCVARVSDQPVTLWRVQTENNRGPFACIYAYDAMDEALLDVGLPGYHNSMPSPERDGLAERPGLLCAATSPRQLVRWFPKPARRALADLHYLVVRYDVAPGGAQIGANQALFDPALATRTGSRQIARVHAAA